VRLIRATEADQLAAMPIHDAWFEPDDVVHDLDSRTVTVPFAQHPESASDAPPRELVRKGRWSSVYRTPLLGWKLVIYNVLRVRHDHGWGDCRMLFDLHYGPISKTLIIESNGSMQLEVESLQVEASGGEEVVMWSRLRVGRFGDETEHPWQ
jgi:hypothetical protein